MTILIVEDDAEVRGVLRMIVERLGYQALVAHDGTEAYALALRHQPTLVIIDLLLPGMDGWRATQRLKSEAATAAIPVVAISGWPTEEAAGRAFAAGCDAFLPKPFDVGDVRRVVSGLLGPARR